MRRTAAGLLALLAACASSPVAPSAGDRLAAGEASSDGAVRVEAIRLDLSGRPNAMGAPCEIDVVNPSSGAVRRAYRVVYLSHTGAELQYVEDAWTPLELPAGGHRTLRHTCPFRTARQARLELRATGA